ncbi:MAG TPA: hypothetical protein VH500_24270 [Nitrososphaeraceae archaeon]|jgi:hypothetical protein
MCAHHEESESHGYKNMTTVALSILVMGISLALVILLWVWIGYIGPSFSADTLVVQQKTLRDQYHLPYQPVVTDPKVQLTPPSLRALASNHTSTNST